MNQSTPGTAHQSFSLVNLKTVVSVQLEAELAAWESGERPVNVSNQFDRYVLETAIDRLGEHFEAAASDLTPEQGYRMSVMSWAHRLSDFDVPELDSAWVD